MKVSTSIIWNVCGTTLPLVVGVAVIPTIVRQLGVTRFGVLSVIWMMIGYFSVFDLGLSRTLTKVTADRVGTPAEGEIPSLVSTTIVMVLVCSIVVSVGLAACSRLIAVRILHVPLGMASDVSGAIVWLSISLPFVLLATALIGVLEGFHRFAVTSSVRLPLGILMFLIPFGVLSFSNRLATITAALTGLRVITVVVLALIGLRVIPGLSQGATSFRKDQIKPLLTFGGWLTVSNVIGPLLAYFDRFVIAALLGAAAVAYYSVPYDTLSRLLVFPTAIQGVLFPAFATLRAQSPSRVAAVFRKSSEKTFLLMIPAVLAVMLFASEGLRIWLGAGFARESTVVAKVLILGVFVNALARAPFVMVQGYGYARWTALLHLFELPAYALVLWILLERDGIVGVAIAWSSRVVVDTAVLYGMASRLEGGLRGTALRDAAWMALVCAVAVALSLISTAVLVRFAIVGIVASCCALVLLRDLKRVFLAPDTIRNAPRIRAGIDEP